MTLVTSDDELIVSPHGGFKCTPGVSTEALLRGNAMATGTRIIFITLLLRTTDYVAAYKFVGQGWCLAANDKGPPCWGGKIKNKADMQPLCNKYKDCVGYDIQRDKGAQHKNHFLTRKNPASDCIL